MFASSRSLLLGAVGSGGGAATRRTTRIVIPSLDKVTRGSTASSGAESSRPSSFAKGGALNTKRFMADPSSSNSNGSSSSGRRRLYEDTPYVSESKADRWVGKGPLNLVKPTMTSGDYGSSASYRMKRGDAVVDPNDHTNTFSSMPNAPTERLTSPGEEVAGVVGGMEAEFMRQRRERQRFLNAVDEQHEQVWRDSKSHIRGIERSMALHGGLEGAIEQRLGNKVPSLSSEIRNRPLDKRILEEIYKDLHGKRSEETLKKNIGHERWTAKSDRNAPVMAASRKAQETFGFGGTAQIVKQATCREQFPITPLPEVAFLGRTNSGRSSLINAILNSYVCRYGHMKGTTKTADFVNVADKLMLVDLPGYGYFHPFASDPLRVKQGQAINEAYIASCANRIVNVPKKQQQQQSKGAHHADAAEDQSSGEPKPKYRQSPDDSAASASNVINGKQRNVKRIFICVPAVTGLQEGDLSLCNMLEERAIPFSVLLTKTDLLAVRALARMTDYNRGKLAKYTHCEELMLVNALRLAGIGRVQNLLGNIARKESLAVDPLEMSFDTIV